MWFVNGTRADDLAGRGLSTPRRVVIPLTVNLLWRAIRGLARGLVWLVASAVRHPLTAATIAAPVAVGFEFGRWGLLALLGVTGLVLSVWLWFAPDSLDRLVIQRARGTWRWVTCYRRLWYPALHGCGLTKTTPDRQVFLPTITRVRSTRVVDTVDVRLLHGHTPEDLLAQAEGLRHAFSAYRCQVNEIKPGRVRIRFYARDPLTTILPPLDPMKQKGGMPDLRGLPVGMAEDGCAYALRLRGRQVLIVGDSDAGKGSGQWSTLYALAPGVHAGTVRLYGFDLKRMELIFAPRLFHRLVNTVSASVLLLEELVEIMQQRQDRLSGVVRDHTASVEEPTLVVVIDELSTLTAYCTDRDAKRRIEAALSLILSQGRAVGVHVIAATQDPRKEVLGSFRGLFTLRICLRVKEAAHVDLALGDGALDRGATCHLIPETLPGVAYVQMDGVREPVRIRFTWISDDDIRDLNTRWPAPAHQTISLPEVIDLTEYDQRAPGLPDQRPGSEPRGESGDATRPGF